MSRKPSSRDIKIDFTQEQITNAMLVLQENGGNISATSRQLGISRHFLRRWRDSEGLPDDLKDREHMFAHEYMHDFCATSAAIRVGHDPNSASKAGYRFMQTPRVREKIQEIMADRAKHIKIDENRIIKELACIAFSDIFNYLDIDKDGNIEFCDFAKLSASQKAAVQEVKMQTVGGKTTVKVKLYDKMKALDLLCNLLMLKNRTNEKEDPYQKKRTIYDEINEKVYNYVKNNNLSKN